MNSGASDDAKLDALMTPAFAKTMNNILGGDVGHRYPGPIPFAPVAVKVLSSSRRQINACFVSAGFAVQPVSGQPAAPYAVKAIITGATLVNGAWRVDSFYRGEFSCTGVVIAQVRA